MIEMAAPDDRLFELYEQGGKLFPLIHAVLSGRQPGRVYVDDAANPTAAWVQTRFLFCTLLGAENKDFDAWLTERFVVGDLDGDYHLWYAPPKRWAERLQTLGEDVRVRPRTRFRFDLAKAAYLTQPDELPDGLALAPLSERTLAASEPLGMAMDSRFWPNTAALFEHGVGAFLMRGDSVVSACYAAAASGGHAEVDIVTPEAERGHGYARIVARAFARQCCERGITPAWDCFDYNAPSMRLAEGLGFVPATTYDLYSFNTPLKAIERIAT